MTNTCPTCGQPMPGGECPRCQASAIAKPEHAEQAKVTPPVDGAIRAGAPPVESKPQAWPYKEPWPYKHEPGPWYSLNFGCRGWLILGVLAVAAFGILLFPGYWKVHQAKLRTQSTANMKEIYLACFAYHDIHKRFPAPRMAVLKNGKMTEVGLSWRVEILPLMDRGAVFDQFDKTVAWDHERNAHMKEKMPDVFK